MLAGEEAGKLADVTGKLGDVAGKLGDVTGKLEEKLGGVAGKLGDVSSDNSRPVPRNCHESPVGKSCFEVITRYVRQRKAVASANTREIFSGEIGGHVAVWRVENSSTGAAVVVILSFEGLMFL